MNFIESYVFVLCAIATGIGLLFLKYLSSAIGTFAAFCFVASSVVWLFVFSTDLWIPLVLLAIFYAGFLLVSSKKIRKSYGVVTTLLPLLLVKTQALPELGVLGLSFATFRAIDVLLYQSSEDGVEFGLYALYVFFPFTLLAGPMYRWRNFHSDIGSAYSNLNLTTFIAGWEKVLLGLVQKFLFASAISRLILDQIAPDDYSAKGIALSAFCYSAFLYFDFAGYSNMAVGLAKMFGFSLPINFRSPILSKNPQDFWRRWHVSLSEWLRDVVFMPIYKYLSRIRFFSAKKLLIQNIGIFVTLLIMGTWNGLQRDYVLSGVLFGVISVTHNSIGTYSKKQPELAVILGSPLGMVLGRIMTVVSACGALYVFSGRSPL